MHGTAHNRLQEKIESGGTSTQSVGRCQLPSLTETCDLIHSNTNRKDGDDGDVCVRAHTHSVRVRTHTHTCANTPCTSLHSSTSCGRTNSAARSPADLQCPPRDPPGCRRYTWGRCERQSLLAPMSGRTLLKRIWCQRTKRAERGTHNATSKNKSNEIQQRLGTFCHTACTKNPREKIWVKRLMLSFKDMTILFMIGNLASFLCNPVRPLGHVHRITFAHVEAYKHENSPQTHFQCIHLCSSFRTLEM